MADFNTAAELLRSSIRAIFEAAGQPRTTKLHFYHPDAADVAVDLNRMTVEVDDTKRHQTHFFSIDRIVHPPSDGCWVMRTDRHQPVAPSTPKPSRASRLIAGFGHLLKTILNPEIIPTAPPPRLVIERDSQTTSRVSREQVKQLFSWIAGASVVVQEVKIDASKA